MSKSLILAAIACVLLAQEGVASTYNGIQPQRLTQEQTEALEWYQYFRRGVVLFICSDELEYRFPETENASPHERERKRDIENTMTYEDCLFNYRFDSALEGD